MKALAHVVGLLEHLLPVIFPPDEQERLERHRLNPKQFRFTFMCAMLILKARALGFDPRLEEAFSKDGHHAHSLHYEHLAADLSLFRDGIYLVATEAHRELGEWWESIGGTWGGRFKDGNHYSLEHKGMR